MILFTALFTNNFSKWLITPTLFNPILLNDHNIELASKTRFYETFPRPKIYQTWSGEESLLLHRRW